MQFPWGYAIVSIYPTRRRKIKINEGRNPKTVAKKKKEGRNDVDEDEMKEEERLSE